MVLSHWFKAIFPLAVDLHLISTDRSINKHLAPLTLRRTRITSDIHFGSDGPGSDAITPLVFHQDIKEPRRRFTRHFNLPLHSWQYVKRLPGFMCALNHGCKTFSSSYQLSVSHVALHIRFGISPCPYLHNPTPRHLISVSLAQRILTVSAHRLYLHMF